MDVQPFTGDADEILEGVCLAPFTTGSHARAQNFQTEPLSRVERSHAHEQSDRVSDNEPGFVVSSKVLSSLRTEPPWVVFEG